MPRKTAFIILGILIFSTILIMVLYYRVGENIQYSQNFVRLFPKQKYVKRITTLNLDSDSLYLSGLDKEHIYLGTRATSLKVLIVDKNLKEFHEVILKLKDNDTIRFENPRIQIDSPYFYVKDGSKPIILKGMISDWAVTLPIKLNTYFNQSVFISENAVAIQSTVTKEGEKKYKKILGIAQIEPSSMYSSPVYFNPEALETQIDEYYSPSGTLRYCKNLKQLIYTYHYRNKYEVLNTSLDKIGAGQTIDSISQVKIKPVYISESTTTLASPPALVNLNSQVFKNFLFVHSNLMGGLEKRSDFDNASVIDVYDLSIKSYKRSFYIPDFEGSKIENFLISDNVVYVKFKNALVSYDIKNLLLDVMQPKTTAYEKN